jgi:phosphoesterase RecJ-like protein
VHKNPDGDTLGSAFALCIALQKMKKFAKVLCSDPIPQKFLFMQNYVQNQDFLPETFVTTDISDPKLLGEKLSIFAQKIDISIDHHISSKNYADFSYVDASAAANCEIIYDLLCRMIGEINICKEIAECLYIGIITDTNCFLFSNTTAKTHQIAARLIEKGINISEINGNILEKKSKALMQFECIFFNTLEFFFQDKCAIGYIMLDTLQKLGLATNDVDGISSIPRKIKGVDLGITIRQIEEKIFRISIRTATGISGVSIAEFFGGGGHLCTGGCEIRGELPEVKEKILNAVKTHLKWE